MTVAPALLYGSLVRQVEALLAAGDRFDLIDAHYFYPDGIAAALLGRRLGKPVLITARGTDLNLIPQHALPRRMILWAANQAAGLITVCQALKDVLVDLRSEEHTSDLQSLMRISYAVFCLKQQTYEPTSTP